MRAISGISVALAVLLSACSQAAEPSTLPTPSDATVSSSVPSEAEPTSETSKPEGELQDPALALLEEYLTTANQALSDPQAVAVLTGQFAPSCSVCQSGLEATQSLHTRGHSIQGGRLVDTSVTQQDETGEQSVFTVTGTIEAATELDPYGTVVKNFQPVTDVTLVYTVRLQPDGSWLIVSGELLG